MAFKKIFIFIIVLVIWGGFIYLVEAAPDSQTFRDLIPVTDSTEDLGTRAIRWQFLYSDDILNTGYVDAARFVATSTTATSTFAQRVAIGTTTPYTNAALNVESQSATDHGLIVQGAASQTAHIFMIRDNAGTILLNTQANGEVDIFHTATANNEIGIHLEVDAAGFGDVIGQRIDYVTGALAGGEDTALLLLNLNRFASTGGGVNIVECLATTGGAAGECLHVGVGIDAIHQTVGTFGDMDSCTYPGLTDILSSCTSTASDATLFETNNSELVIGDAATFGEIEFILATEASGAGIKPKFEYSTGADTWTEFNAVDGTNGMRDSGNIVIPIEDISWATGTSSRFYIRITRTQNNITTDPVEDIIQISAVVDYRWDLSGDVEIRDLIARNSTTTTATSTSLAITELSSALVRADASGSLHEYAGSSCTNQFVRSLDAVGAATCATVGAADVGLANLTALNTSLTFSGTYDGSTARTIVLNVGNANDWTALQTFTQASSTLFSVTNTAYFGGTATSTFGSTGELTLVVDLTVPNGGTGASTFTDGGILLGSGAGAFTVLGAAANGQIPIGDGATDPVLATLTATANETEITNGAGSITIGLPDAVTIVTLTLTNDLAVTQGGTGVSALDDIVGTANEITVGAGANTIIGGDVTLSIPNTLYGGASFEVGRDADNNFNFATDNELTVDINAVSSLVITGSLWSFNNTAANIDFSIDGDVVADLFFLNAGTDRVGISSTTPMSIFGVAGTTTTETLNVDDPNHTGTSTLYIYSDTAAFGGEIILEDHDAAGCTAIYTLNGTVIGTEVTCPTAPIAN